MVLESNQFNQLVEEVKKALLVGSQGVGDVEIVDSLADIVSLPALRLAGMEESVVEQDRLSCCLPLLRKLLRKCAKPKRSVS